jgi:hypothetical protein
MLTALPCAAYIQLHFQFSPDSVWRSRFCSVYLGSARFHMVISSKIGSQLTSGLTTGAAQLPHRMKVLSDGIPVQLPFASQASCIRWSNRRASLKNVLNFVINRRICRIDRDMGGELLEQQFVLTAQFIVSRQFYYFFTIN